MRIVIFGAPGVGKGTQAHILSEKLDIPHISTGDILRNAIKNETALGLEAKKLVESGNLVPDDIMAGIVKDVLSDKSCEKGFILDGYPRTLEQARLLDEILKSLPVDSQYFLAIDVDDEVIVQRLTNRLTCKICGNIFNISDLRDLKICPKCNGIDSFFKRKDDEESVIRNRLKVFHSTTKPVLEYYTSQGRLKYVDGTMPVDKVAEELLQEIKA
ncbi:MAG: adenylate kinase [Ignavibacteria bacterium]|jgi:adenylate kinase|nr:adenylate kinase [Ignavibacteria bacterium]MCU7504060.1 adenylate kinase [Ignavibacteria bacterium]MCU7515432.1 adenylate kinase [Ignavibacteria bacterium]